MGDVIARGWKGTCYGSSSPGHPGAAGRGLRRPHRLASDRPPGPARLPRAAGPAHRRLTSSLGVNAMTVHASWREAAACRDADPDLFFPIGTAGPALRQIQEAKRICRACPAQAPCLAWALDHGVGSGVWGGYTEAERRVLRRPRGQKSAVMLAGRDLHGPVGDLGAGMSL